MVVEIKSFVWSVPDDPFFQCKWDQPPTFPEQIYKHETDACPNCPTAGRDEAKIQHLLSWGNDQITGLVWKLKSISDHLPFLAWSFISSAGSQPS